VLLSHDRNVLLLDEGSVLLVDDRLMVLVDVLLVDDGLSVLMDDVLVMFVQNVLLVFDEHIFVMLMNDILMDFLHDSCISVLLGDASLLSSHSFLSFVERLHDSLLLMGDHDGGLVDLLDNGFSSRELLEVGLVNEGLVGSRGGRCEVLSLHGKTAL
jgi:hypothetical protein